MKLLKPVLLAIGIAAGAATAAYADEPFNVGSSTDMVRAMVSQYRDYVAKMSAENRAKLAAMEDKIMQMEMEHKNARNKMDMEMAKAQRDLQMFILSAGSEGH